MQPWCQWWPQREWHFTRVCEGVVYLRGKWLWPSFPAMTIKLRPLGAWGTAKITCPKPLAERAICQIVPKFHLTMPKLSYSRWWTLLVCVCMCVCARTSLPVDLSDHQDWYILIPSSSLCRGNGLKSLGSFSYPSVLPPHPITLPQPAI